MPEIYLDDCMLVTFFPIGFQLPSYDQVFSPIDEGMGTSAKKVMWDQSSIFHLETLSLSNFSDLSRKCVSVVKGFIKEEDQDVNMKLSWEVAVSVYNKPLNTRRKWKDIVGSAKKSNWRYYNILSNLNVTLISEKISELCINLRLLSHLGLY